MPPHANVSATWSVLQEAIDAPSSPLSSPLSRPACKRARPYHSNSESEEHSDEEGRLARNDLPAPAPLISARTGPENTSVPINQNIVVVAKRTGQRKKL
ncbi:hypothetical protein A0H81_05603 [Grifola frondosa]|uniref:Uncharacterized protein n=1 Tax=Grifola frondosa TaxID=5627 RepID=A0A1C7MDK5_GRIFR|nr:hypothetical protein A0H81_05603 [Grifola frondosa]